MATTRPVAGSSATSAPWTSGIWRSSARSGRAAARPWAGVAATGSIITTSPGWSTSPRRRGAPPTTLPSRVGRAQAVSASSTGSTRGCTMEVPGARSMKPIRASASAVSMTTPSRQSGSMPGGLAVSLSALVQVWRKLAAGATRATGPRQPPRRRS